MNKSRNETGPLRLERCATKRVAWAICRRQWLYLRPTPYWSLSGSSIKAVDSEHDITGLLSRHGACSLQRIARVLGPQVPAFKHARQRRSLRDPAWDKNAGMNWIVKKPQHFLGWGTPSTLLLTLRIVLQYVRYARGMLTHSLPAI